MKELLGEDTFLNQALTEVLVISYATNIRKPLLFTSFCEKENQNYKNFLEICSPYKMYQAAMATSATPTFFQPYHLVTTSSEREEYFLIDGGVIANNPTTIAIIEAMKTYQIKENKQDLLNISEILVVSLGTGTTSESFSKETDKWGLIHWLKPLKDLFFSSQNEVIDYQMEQLFHKKQYYRFQFNCEKEYKKYKIETNKKSPSQLETFRVSDEMDNTTKENIDALELAATSLIKEQEEQLDSLCKTLIESLETRVLLKHQ